MKPHDSLKHATIERFGTANLTLMLELLLSACATGVPPRTPVIAMPAAFEAPASGQLHSLDHWWTHYADPQLTTLIERALSRGFSVRESIARLQEDQALRLVALSQFNPQGNLQANTEHRNTRYLNQATSSARFKPACPRVSASAHYATSATANRQTSLFR